MKEEILQDMVTGSMGYKVKITVFSTRTLRFHPKYVTIWASHSISLFLSFQIHKMRILISTKTPPWKQRFFQLLLYPLNLEQCVIHSRS